MKQFNDKNFVLETEVAQDLYHNHAAKMPIIDYHCHLIPEMVANDHKFNYKFISSEKFSAKIVNLSQKSSIFAENIHVNVCFYAQ